MSPATCLNAPECKWHREPGRLLVGFAHDPSDWIFNEQVGDETIKVGGKTYRRDPDVFDTWFSSGQWPYITTGYPDGTFRPTLPLTRGEGLDLFERQPGPFRREVDEGQVAAGGDAARGIGVHLIGTAGEREGQAQGQAQQHPDDAHRHLGAEIGDEVETVGIEGRTTTTIAPESTPSVDTAVESATCTPLPPARRWTRTPPW